MTADWYIFPPEVLRKVSSRITNEVAGINRVTYDISSKPPAVSAAVHLWFFERVMCLSRYFADCRVVVVKLFKGSIHGSGAMSVDLGFRSCSVENVEIINMMGRAPYIFMKFKVFQCHFLVSD